MHAATKQYVDLLIPSIGDRVLRAGDTMTGFLTLNDNPTLPLHAATRQFVEAIAASNTGAVKIADTPPAGPIHGTLWWESDTGLLWMYYNDGTSVQWVEVSGSLTSDPSKADKTYVDSQNALRVLKAGDTMTGDLLIDKSQARIRLNAPNVGNEIVAVIGQKGGANRWTLQLGEGSAETGGSVGSDFALLRFNDAGVASATLGVNRATGNMSLYSTAPSTSPTTGALTVAGGLGVGGDAHHAGNIEITKSQPRFRINADPSTDAAISGQKVIGGVNKPRWTMIVGNGTLEGGSNSGSDFNINRFDDAGSSLGIAFSINRASGSANISSTTASTSPSTGALTVAGGLGVVGNIYTSSIIASQIGGAASGIGNGAVNIGVKAGWWGILTRPENDSGPAHLVFQNTAGTVVGSISTGASSASYNTSSDAALKEDLKSFDAGNIIDNTKVYDFAWKSTKERSYGVIAQQAYDVYPQAVTHTDKVDKSEAGPARDEWWGIDYSKYVPVLLQELKALRERVRVLEGGDTAKPSLSQTVSQTGSMSARGDK